MNVSTLRILRSVVSCFVLLSVTPALNAAPPTLTAPTVSQVGANQVTLTLQSSETGTGYFTLLPGTGTTPGTGAQIVAGQDSTGTAAFRVGALPLTANTAGTYTIRNLTAGTGYTVCFTADDGGTVQPTALTVSFTTTAATDLTGSNWTVVGTSGFSAGAVYGTSLVFAPDGTPHVAYVDAGKGYRATVMKFTGGAWSVVGTAGFSSGGVFYTSLAFAPDGTPYVAYQDADHGNGATVMKFSGGVWSVVGTAGFSSGAAYSTSLACAPDGTPYVAYYVGSSEKATVMKFSGGAWSVVGAAGFSAGSVEHTSLAFGPDGTPHVAYKDVGNDYKATVMKFSGGVWSVVGAAGFSEGEVRYTSLAFAPDGTPCVAYMDVVYGEKATVMKFSDGAWSAVGTAGFSAAGAGCPSLAFASDGTPHVAYFDGGSRKATVMKFSGGAWSVVGTAGVSVGQVDYTSLAFAPDGTPHVAYQDNSHNDKATVMKMMAPPAISGVGAPADGAYPAGGHLDFTVNFSSAVTVDSTGGTPRLILNVGGTTRYAGYLSGTGTTAIVFRYAVQAGETDSGGIEVGASIDLNGGTIADTATGLAAVLALNGVGSTSNIRVDTTPPTLAAPTVSHVGANQVTLTLQSTETGTGYFTLLAGIGATPGTGAQTVAGEDSTGMAAFRRGSMPLTANTAGTYTIRNLPAGTDYTVCFTADDGGTVQPTAMAVPFSTTSATDLAGMDWAAVGSAGFSAAAASHTSLAFAPDGTPHIAYYDDGNGGKATVMKFSGGAWSVLGTAGFSEGWTVYTSLAFAPDGTPHVVYWDGINGFKATVMKFSGGAWKVVGTAGFSAGMASSTSLAFAPDGTPHVAYTDGGNSDKATVMRFSGGVWNVVGTAGLSASGASSTSLAFAPDGTPHVAYADSNSGDKATVMKFAGGAWKVVGTAGFSADKAHFSSLAFAPDGTPHVAYKDVGNGDKATVMKFSGEAWSVVGAAGFSTGGASYISLAFAPDGEPHVAFRDVGNGDKATVMKFSGGAWSVVGTAGVSVGQADYTSLAFAPDGTPHVAYQDNGHNDQATVMKMMAPPAVFGVGAPADGAYPAGGHLDFTVNFSSAVSVDTTAGTPRLILNVGGTTRYAGYLSGTGTTAIVFRYTVQAGETDSGGIEVGASIDLNGGTIAAPTMPVSAALVLPPLDSSHVRVDTTAPAISSALTVNGSYRQDGFSYVIVANEPIASYTATGLPAGLSLDATTGIISGEPAAAGLFTVSLGATDLAGNTGVATLSLTVAPAELTISGLRVRNKTYDGSVAASLDASLASLVPLMSGDSVTIDWTNVMAVFTQASAAESIPVTLSGLTLTGVHAVNYRLVPPAATAHIGQATATVALGNLNQIWSGAAKSASATTTPAGLTVRLTYAGDTTAPTNAGDYAVVATIDETNYVGTANGTLTIGKAPQTIAFSSVGEVQPGASIELSATASSGLPVAFSVVSGPATVSGATLSITGGGAIVVRASQAGDANHLAAADVDQTITSTALSQTITFGELADKLASDEPFTLSASASSGLPVAFAVVEGPATIAGSTLTLTGDPGTVIVRASQPGDEVYAAAAEVLRSFEVEADGLRVFFGDLFDRGDDAKKDARSRQAMLAVAKVGEMAAVLPADRNTGSLLIVAPDAGINELATFTLLDDGTFTAGVTQQAGPNLPAEGTLTVRGQLSGRVLSGAIEGTGYRFSLEVEPRDGPSAAMAGLYQSGALVAETGVVYTVIGTNNSVLVLAVTPAYIAGSTTVLNEAGEFVLPITTEDGDGELRGVVNATDSSLRGTVVLPDQSPTEFSGIQDGAARTDRLINLSSRARVGEGEKLLITGFVIGGMQPIPVLVRAVGPGLTPLGVTDALENPQIQIFRAGNPIAENNDWSTAADPVALAAAMARVGASAVADGSTDAALLITLAPGIYTAHVTAADDSAPGVALAEIYDASETLNSEYNRLVNISSRGEASTGDNILIGGFVVRGNAPKRILLRGVGPALAAQGITTPLADPVLSVFQGPTVIAQNDDWDDDPAKTAENAAAAATTGAFALSAGSTDAAMILNLAPGIYTVHVSAKSGTASGIALVEIYEIPEL